MHDRLTITDLELWTRMGVPPLERAAEQRLLVTIEMHLDTKPAAKKDDVKQSINYFDVCEDLKKLAKIERKTIERFAKDAALMISKKYKPENVSITVKKFAIPGSAYVAVQISR